MSGKRDSGALATVSLKSNPKVVCEFSQFLRLAQIKKRAPRRDRREKARTAAPNHFLNHGEKTRCRWGDGQHPVPIGGDADGRHLGLPLERPLDAGTGPCHSPRGGAGPKRRITRGGWVKVISTTKGRKFAGSKIVRTYFVELFFTKEPLS